MTRAIQCRREGLTPAELDALTGIFTRPRPDMAFSFDDLQDAKKNAINANREDHKVENRRGPNGKRF